jgi:hypothetical protein
MKKWLRVPIWTLAACEFIVVARACSKRLLIAPGGAAHDSQSQSPISDTVDPTRCLPNWPACHGTAGRLWDGMVGLGRPLVSLSRWRLCAAG